MCVCQNTTSLSTRELKTKIAMLCINNNVTTTNLKKMLTTIPKTRSLSIKVLL